ncbi:hypothetical protein ACFV0C_28660 [Streptomyces sp. NPDC059568]|uniref:hypothetical protein n=1 Tax=Streptomyces sp. NPDC059568 TaxID=3346868 RepID=UPI0036754792
MIKTKKKLFGALGAAIAVLAVLGAGPAQGAPGGEKDKEPVRTTAPKGDSLAPDHTADTDTVAPSPAVTSALATIQKRIADHVAAHGTTYTFASYVDPATGRIVLETDAPAGLVSELTDLSGAGAAQSQAADRLQLRPATTTDTFDRRNDTPPFYGGGGIAAEGFLCSSGYAVQRSGVRFITTAGHCFNNGTTVVTESGANTYGTVSDRRLPPVTGDAADMELIGGQSYAGRVFTGGVTSSTSIPVVSAGGAVVGFNNYCHSGRTTGEQCGHTATSTTAQVCTATGCKSPVIAYTGGTLQQGGDSGGAFYAKDNSGAYIRGHVIAGNNTTGYIQPWTVVTAMLGVAIVTG